jgi:hypothetical protein
MERWQLIVIVVVVTSAWYLYKRFVKKERIWGEGYRPPQPKVENWFATTMDAVDNMEGPLRAEKEAAWDTKSDDEKLKYSETFMRNEFGQEAIEGYNRKQRIKIGLAHFLTSETEDGDEPEEQSGE